MIFVPLLYMLFRERSQHSGSGKCGIDRSEVMDGLRDGLLCRLLADRMAVCHPRVWKTGRPAAEVSR